MSNMGHCAFENTHKDLKDCYEKLLDKGVDAIEADASEYERPYIKKLILLCNYICDEFKEL